MDVQQVVVNHTLGTLRAIVYGVVRKLMIIRRSLLYGMMTAQMLLLSSCRKSPEAASTTAQPAGDSQAAPSKERHHRFFGNGVSPLIVSMSPDTISFHDGHLPLTRYSLTYEIDHSEKASKAYISVYATGIGEVKRFDVDVQPRAQIEFLLDASDFDFGPTVRFRVHCPYGDTDWYTMGTVPANYAQAASTRQIGSINPLSIPPAGARAGGVPIMIASGLIMKTCTAEAQVDSSSVDLQNVVAVDKRITALLPFDALQGRPVTPRYLEIKLVVTGPGIANEDIYQLNFAE